MHGSAVAVEARGILCASAGAVYPVAWRGVPLPASVCIVAVVHGYGDLRRRSPCISACLWLQKQCIQERRVLVAVRAVAPERRSAFVYIRGILGEHFDYMGILRMADRAVHRVVVALVCIVAGGALGELCDVIGVRRQWLRFGVVMRRTVAYDAGH